MAQVPATQRGQGGKLAGRRENPLERLQRDFDTLFGRMWGGWLSPADQDAQPMRVWDFDVTENDKEILVRAEVPGFEENELDVQLNNNVLTIKAEKEQKGDGREEYRSFYRAVALPSGIDAEKVQATYHNGVLELHIPRAEGAQPRHIQVQRDEAGNGARSQKAGTQTQQAGSQTPAKGSEKAEKAGK